MRNTFSSDSNNKKNCNQIFLFQNFSGSSGPVPLGKIPSQSLKKKLLYCYNTFLSVGLFFSIFIICLPTKSTKHEEKTNKNAKFWTRIWFNNNEEKKEFVHANTLDGCVMTHNSGLNIKLLFKKCLYLDSEFGFSFYISVGYPVLYHSN